MKDSIKQIERFHAAFGHDICDGPSVAESTQALRFDLIHEELYEYQQACAKNDIVDIADALGDLLVVVYGAIVVHGLQDCIQPVFDEIMRANMSKLGIDGKPVYRADGKILKGESYVGPDIERILQTMKGDINVSKP
jgi:predicted HAD superfamily Cof-like phosphohydrolase